jgi:hypothetical protein
LVLPFLFAKIFNSQTDTPGELHPIISRGIERKRIFQALTPDSRRESIIDSNKWTPVPCLCWDGLCKNFGNRQQRAFNGFIIPGG